MRRIPVVAALALILSAWPSATASAEIVDIPAFARKYRVSCSLCHAPAPRLTAFGEMFAANGFVMAPGEAPRDTIQTGDPLLLLQTTLPLAIRFDGYLSTYMPELEDGTRLDFQSPWGIKLLSGGQVSDHVSYYMYFFMSERGEVAGLEDAFLHFRDIAGTGTDVIGGQFQVSDPLFKRELRLEVADYAAYRVRVGDVRADLTYDRGLMVSHEVAGGDLIAMVVTGRGLEPASERLVFDSDRYKNFAGRYSRDVGPIRLGAFAYYGIEEGEAERTDQLVIWGPDATIPIGSIGELNLQYLHRTDDNPLFLATEPAEATKVDAGFAELIVWPNGPGARLFFTALYNHVAATDGLFSVRLGEEAGLTRYRFGSVGAQYLLRRNLRGLAELGYDLDREDARLTIGAMAAF